MREEKDVLGSGSDAMARREPALQLDARPVHVPRLHQLSKGRGCRGHRREAKLRRLARA